MERIRAGRARRAGASTVSASRCTRTSSVRRRGWSCRWSSSAGAKPLMDKIRLSTVSIPCAADPLGRAVVDEGNALEPPFDFAELGKCFDWGDHALRQGEIGRRSPFIDLRTGPACPIEPRYYWSTGFVRYAATRARRSVTEDRHLAKSSPSDQSSRISEGSARTRSIAATACEISSCGNWTGWASTH